MTCLGLDKISSDVIERITKETDALRVKISNPSQDKETVNDVQHEEL